MIAAAIEPDKDRHHIPRGAARALLVVMFGLIAGLAGLGAWVLAGPDVAALAASNPRSTAFIDRYREEEIAAGRSPDLAWAWVPGSRISPHLKRAVLVSEDISFFSHRGFAPDELRIALREALAAGRALRGASTITQQLAKNLWLSPSRNPVRKAREALLTWQLERHLSKERILELYLNVVEFGRGIYGAEAAAREYFGKPAASLSEHEAALLAASLPRPRRWNPRSDSDTYLTHVALIEARMDKAQFLWRRLGLAPPPGTGEP